MSEINSYDYGVTESYDDAEFYADENEGIEEYSDGMEGDVGFEGEGQEDVGPSAKERLESLENSVRKSKEIDPEQRKEELKKLRELDQLLHEIGDGKDPLEQGLAETFDAKLAEIENEVIDSIAYGDLIKEKRAALQTLETELVSSSLAETEKAEFKKSLDETREALAEDPMLNVEEALQPIREGLEAAKAKAEKTQAKEKKIEEIRNTLQNGIGKVGYRNKPKVINNNRIEYYSEAPYSAGSGKNDSREKAEDVKKVLDLMVQALGETDESKKKDAWNKVNDLLGQWKTQGIDAGHVNDRAQLLFNVLYGELGEEGLKEAFEQGIIPAEFSNNLIQLLEIKPDENTSTKEATTLQQGGPGWTHATSSEWLKKYGKASETEIEGDE